MTLSSFNANVYAETKDISALFPSMQGWTPKGKPDVYTPDNLFEYINGAADVFLSYDFQQLATVTFENAKKHSFTVDIYRHGSERNGFGIYSQERSSKGPFLPIGTQGYYEQGVLNFLRGAYYVKMSGFDLGENDKQVLYAYAEKLAKNLEGDSTFPAAVTCFPGEGKVSNSEGFISKNFLGHSFLHSAFTADYEKDGRPYRVFIIETKSNTGTESILKNYLAFLEKKGVAVEKKENFYRFQDPYYRSSGKLNFKIANNYIWGLFSKNDTMGEMKVLEIEKELKKKGLIK
jgi:hypothetical protein